MDNIIKPTNVCLNHQDAEYLIQKHTFGGEQCPEKKWIYQGGPENFCMTNTSLGDYGFYEAGGRWTNQTVETVTKDQVIESIGYQCDGVDVPKVSFKTRNR